MKKYIINGLITFSIVGFWVGFKTAIDEWRGFGL